MKNRLFKMRLTTCRQCPSYAALVGRTNVGLELLELQDGRSYKVQYRSACRTRQAENCMGEGLLTRDHTAPRTISICPPHQNCVVSPSC